ncbi:MAG TPA: protein kinase [Gammaproteobacteria bacterium]|nr:protein kinase [Gammaproteobacteria bacterium]
MEQANAVQPQESEISEKRRAVALGILATKGAADEVWIAKTEEIKKLNLERKLLDDLFNIIILVRGYSDINFDSPLVKNALLYISFVEANILADLSSTPRTLEQRLRLTRLFQKNRMVLESAGKYKEMIDAVYDTDVQLQLFLEAKADSEERLNHAYIIANNINAYTSTQMLTFLKELPHGNHIGKYESIQNTVIEKLVDGLKDYKENMFYFNPKRLFVTKLVDELEQKTAELIDTPTSLPAVLTRKVPTKFIDELRRTGKEFKRYGHYELIKIHHSKFYVVDFEKKLGQGKFGAVYQAYFVNPENGEFGEKFVVKTMATPEDKAEQEYQALIKDEVKALSRNFKVEPAIRHPKSGKTYLISEYIQGRTLGHHDERNVFHLDSSVQNLSSAQMMKAIWLLMVDVARVHSAKSSGSAFVLGDIKPENVQVLVENGEVRSVQNLDYGFATEFTSEDPKALVDLKLRRGSRGFVAPEIFQDKIGLTSDVRSLVPVILYMLRASNPLKGLTYENKALDEYSFEGIFSGMESEIPLKYRVAIINFLRRMASNHHRQRPTSAEAMEFFHVIKNYFLCEDQKERDALFEDNKSLLDQPHQYKWTVFLYLLEDKNPTAEVKAMLAELAQEVKPQGQDNQLILLRYFAENSAGNEDKFQELSDSMCDSRKRVIINNKLNQLRDLTKHYVGNEAEWETAKADVFGHEAFFTEDQKIIYHSLLKTVEIHEQLKELSRLTENYAGNEAAWKKAASSMLVDKEAGKIIKTMPLSLPGVATRTQKLTYYYLLNQHREVALTIEGLDKSALNKVSLPNFIALSKTQNYENNKALWRNLAESIAENIDQYDGKDMLMFLRKLNKFNKSGEYNVIRQKVIDALLMGLTKAYGDNKAERQKNSTVKYVEDAIKQDLFLFKSYRVQYRLKKACKDKDEALTDVVNRITAPAA